MHTTKLRIAIAGALLGVGALVTPAQAQYGYPEQPMMEMPQGQPMMGAPQGGPMMGMPQRGPAMGMPRGRPVMEAPQGAPMMGYPGPGG